jgi:hypothetical protein
MLAMMAGVHPVGLQNWLRVHTASHEPQWRGSRPVSAQWSTQHSKPTGHADLVVQVAMHCPVEQTRPSAHSVSERQLAQSWLGRHFPLAQAASFLQPGTQAGPGPQYLPAGQESFVPATHATQV